MQGLAGLAQIYSLATLYHYQQKNKGSPQLAQREAIIIKAQYIVGKKLLVGFSKFLKLVDR